MHPNISNPEVLCACCRLFPLLSSLQASLPQLVVWRVSREAASIDAKDVRCKRCYMDAGKQMPRPTMTYKTACSYVHASILNCAPLSNRQYCSISFFLCTLRSLHMPKISLSACIETSVGRVLQQLGFLGRVTPSCRGYNLPSIGAFHTTFYFSFYLITAGT